MRPHRIFQTSSFRHALMYAGLTGLSFLVLFGVIFWSTARFMRHQIDDSVSSELDEILTDPQAASPETIGPVVDGLARHSSGFYYLLQDSKGAAKAGNLPPMEPLEGVHEWGKATKTSDAAYASVRGRGVKIGSDYLFVGWSTHQLREMEEMVVGSFVWGLAASIVLALAGGVVTSRRLLRKIEIVSETSRNIIAGDLGRRVPVSRTNDEFDHLAESVNAMLDRIQTLMDELGQVTTNIAHDLRTPLTRLRHRLELAQRSDIDAQSLRETLTVTISEVDAILRIFSALLRIAQIESGARRSAFKALSLSDLLSTVAELYRPNAEENHQVLIENIDEDLQIKGDHELLMQCFANLVENALRHSPSGATIVLEAHRAAGIAQVTVTDNGPGIPAELHAKVLQRFYRLENSRTTPGNGLGLSLANAIVKLHDATMTLADHRPGLAVTVSLALRA